jgi:hypothetical protein
VSPERLAKLRKVAEHHEHDNHDVLPAGIIHASELREIIDRLRVAERDVQLEHSGRLIAEERLEAARRASGTDYATTGL